MEKSRCVTDAGVYDCDDEYCNLVTEERLKFLEYIDSNVIGVDAAFDGPFGERQVIYCDYTASGRPLKFIEDYVMKNVYPHYGNTHTTTTLVSKQTTKFRHDAREIIRNNVNAGSDDVVIFCGSGATGAIHKIYQVMQLTEERAKTAVVFVGPFEHHSNILPWKESGAKVIRIRETMVGTVDLAHLESQLVKEKENAGLMIGVFSSASNVTGILTNTEKVAGVLHKHGALSFWDYATAGPYLKIDMNPASKDGLDCSKDAVFLSCHKFVGGVGTPGLLIAKRKLFKNRVPATAGGGTVSYVSREKHYYLKDIESREEGGTPAITESIRAGMAFQLKEAVGPDVIEAREEELCRRAFNKWQHNKNLIILGNKRPRRLPIFSFLVKHEKSGKLLHHNFVCTLLNDLYGVQARGGCACAGPYAHDLLGITEQIADEFIRVLDEDRKQKENKEPLEALRPGFSRITFHTSCPMTSLSTYSKLSTNWRPMAGSCYPSTVSTQPRAPGSIVINHQ
ncbi:probable cysteine desulfurase [Ptychodera flava]|uniref:probable cysteine desulfurase n=1 Tax=Ptychodera flava TaxID=63121 RepID=UPI003969D5DB